MATITSATTVDARAQGSIIKWTFRYVLDVGGTYDQRAWVPIGTDEVTERDRRGVWLLESLAEQEAAGLIGG